MRATKLYKYLDSTGGWMMLQHGNLQFTNAMRLNDPFDCHPSLIDFSNVPKEACGGWTPEIIEELRRDPFRRTREEAWICSLSKIYDSILMWSYYSKHKGVCIGLNMEKARKYLSRIRGEIMIGCLEVEVQYKDIVEKPDYFRDAEDFFLYQVSTKAKAWEHEQEVRLCILEPCPTYMKLLPWQNDDKGPIDWKEMRAFPEIGGECFESVYMGINMSAEEKSKIIRVARKLNPDIKIFQMEIDANAFRLNTNLIE
ncbi:MAG: DUF2971 domain-containing protein [Marinifilaceae bacterium]|nr:DUF2971 domain-containing protein [Marinifilaceae bacterium]